MRKVLFAIVMGVLLPWSVSAQEEKPKTRLDIFAGVDFQYRDLHWNKFMEVMVSLTPGMKMQWGNNWQLATQVIIPVYNDFGDYYGKVRLGITSLSKEFLLGTNHLKVSAGMFSRERYGLDVKWMLPVTDWLAFDAQLGYTGYWSPQLGEGTLPDRVSGWGGARFWLGKWKTEGRVRGGYFAYGDWGALAEIYRHFRHVSVGAYGQYSNKGGLGAGFKVVVMLPPYRQKVRKVNFRPASFFLLSHNVMADPYSVKMYETEPEENDRQGWFQSASWGPYSLSR